MGVKPVVIGTSTSIHDGIGNKTVVVVLGEEGNGALCHAFVT
jgi:hypothetical protein